MIVDERNKMDGDETKHLLELGQQEDRVSENADHTQSTTEEEKLSSSRQWMVLVAFLILQFVTTCIDTFLFPFFTETALEKGLHEIQIGIIFCAYDFSRFAGSTILVSWIISRSARGGLLMGGVLTSVACAAFGLAKMSPDGGWFFSLCLVIRLAAGIGSGVLTTTSTSIMLKTTSFSPSTIMASMESVFGIGAAAGPALGALIYAWLGYTISFIPLGVVTLISTLVALYLIPSIKSDGRVSESSGEHTLLRLMIIPGIMLMFFSVIANKVAGQGFIIFASDFLIKKMNLTITSAGLVLAGGSVCYIVGAIVSSKLVNSFDLKWTQLMVSWPFLGLMFMFITPSPLLNFLFHGKRFLAMTLSTSYLSCVAMACIYVPPLQIALEIASLYGYPRDDMSTYTKVSGMVHGGISLGAALSPILAGFVTQIFSFDWTVTVSAFLSFFMTLLTGGFLLTIRLLGKSLK